MVATRNPWVRARNHWLPKQEPSIPTLGRWENVSGNDQIDRRSNDHEHDEIRRRPDEHQQFVDERRGL